MATPPYAPVRFVKLRSLCGKVTWSHIFFSSRSRSPIGTSGPKLGVHCLGSCLVLSRAEGSSSSPHSLVNVEVDVGILESVLLSSAALSFLLIIRKRFDITQKVKDLIATWDGLDCCENGKKCLIFPGVLPRKLQQENVRPCSRIQSR